jgi:hypothetical protein
MSDDATEDPVGPPMRVVVIGAGDTELGRALARRIMEDDRMRGRIEIIDRFPDEPVRDHEILDLNAAVARIRAERDDLMAPVVPQAEARRVDPYPMQPLDGQSKYDRRRKWWNR